MCLSNVEKQQYGLTHSYHTMGATISQLQWEADIRESEMDRLIQVEKKYKAMERVLFLDVTDDLKISLMKTYRFNTQFQSAII